MNPYKSYACRYKNDENLTNCKSTPSEQNNENEIFFFLYHFSSVLVSSAADLHFYTFITVIMFINILHFNMHIIPCFLYYIDF